MEGIKIYKNFDTTLGEYNWTNEMKVIFSSDVDEKTYEADLGWVYDLSPISNRIDVQSAGNGNMSDDNGIEIHNVDGKLSFSLKVEEKDFFLWPNQSVGEISYEFHADEVFFYTYPRSEERSKTFKVPGIDVEFQIVKKCKSE